MTKEGQPPFEPGVVFDDELILEEETVKSEPDEGFLHRKSSPEPILYESEPEVINKNDDDDEEIEFSVIEDDIPLNLSESNEAVVGGEPRVVESEVMADTGDELSIRSQNGLSRQGSKVRIGDRLVEMGVIDKDQLNVALQEQKITGEMIGEVMVNLGFIDAETLSSYLAQASGFQIFDPKTTILDSEALALIEKPLA